MTTSTGSPRGRPPKPKVKKPARVHPLPFAAARDHLKAILRRGGAPAMLLSAPDAATGEPGTELASPTGDMPLRLALTPEQIQQTREDNGTRDALDVHGLASNSERGLASDWLNWLAFCLHYDRVALPSQFLDVAEFIDMLIACGRKKATLEHHLWAITRMNWRCHCPDPMDGQIPQEWWRARVRDKLSGEQKQAKPFSLRAVELATAGLRDPDRPRQGRRAKPADLVAVERAQRRRDLRDTALINTAYDLMMRSAELVSVEWERIARDPDGSGSYRMGKTKTDQVGTGTMRYLRPETVRDLDAWRDVAGPSPFAFHAVRENDADHEPKSVPDAVTDLAQRERLRWPPLTTQEVGVIFRRAARLAGVAVEHLSGHSTRVGGAQDMVEAGATTDEVQQAGGWKDGRMVAKYAGRPLAKRAGQNRFRKLENARGSHD